MSNYTISGKITAILDARGGTSARTGNAWKVQSFVIETQEQYPNHLCFEVFGEDRINEFNIQLNNVYDVEFYVDAHEYQGRWYNQIRADKVTLKSTGEATQTATAAPPTATPAPTETKVADFNEDDSKTLPF